MPILMKLFPRPPVGLPVQWYPKAQTNQPLLAKAGLITSTEEQGRVSIAVFPKGTGMLNYTDCHHVIDPFHKRRTPNTMQKGGWDFVPGFGPEMYCPGLGDLESHLNRDLNLYDDDDKNQLVEEIIRLHSSRHTVVQIANHVNEEKKLVEKILVDVMGKQRSLAESKPKPQEITTKLNKITKQLSGYDQLVKRVEELEKSQTAALMK